MTALPLLVALALQQLDGGAESPGGAVEDAKTTAADAGSELSPRSYGPPRGLDAQGRPPVDPLPEGELPLMRWEEPVSCGFLQPTRDVPSGHFRIQCDETKRVCLVAPLRELTDDGVEGFEPLTRVQECAVYPSDDWGRRYNDGYKYTRAIAEAPPGWVRDTRGRVMQVNFDLHRRIYIGGGYSPLRLRDGTADTTRYRTDFGVEVEFPGDDGEPTLHRLHILESELFFDTYSADVTLVRYDYSVDRQAPFLRFTTFFGTPRRADLKLDAAGYFKALQLEWIRRNNETNSFLTLGDAEVTFDLWHSKDLVSYVRLRAGAAVEQDALRRFLTGKPVAAFEGDLTLDPDGFHHVTFQVQGEKLFFDPVVPGRVRNPQRLRAKASYEVIFIAINDQPLTFVAEGRAVYRDDLPAYDAGWEFSATAGLRFSFWAPARRTAKTQNELK